MTKRFFGRGRRMTVLVLAGLAAVFVTSVIAVADDGLPRAVTQQDYSLRSAPAANSGDGGYASLGQMKNISGLICTTATSTAANVNTDCETPQAPHNETSIAVNPTDASNMIGGANDYQLTATNGGIVKETVLSRAHVTFDGGKTWSEYAVPFRSYNATGDPAVAFDAAGNAYYSTLGFLFSQGKSPGETNADVLVSHSTDGGKTWTVPSRVGQGVGSLGSASKASLDKEYIAAWGNGNAIVTWTNFIQGPHGAYAGSPLYDSVTHDGGNTWTRPVQISGSAPFCVGLSSPTTCDQDQGSVPVVDKAGHVFVAFESTRDNTTGDDQYLVVQVDPATGQRIAGPFKVADLVDGLEAYPFDIVGRQTYQDSQFRTWSLGNITADPTTAGHLAVVWSDMRNSTLPANPDPYAAPTNSDVVVSQSYDGGQTWSSPVALALAGDQFMPWGAYDSSGALRIGFFDRSYDSANHRYGYTLATETSPGSLSFAETQLTTTLSDPTMGDRWFSGVSVNPDFPNPTQFLGDYSNIASVPAGGVVAYWTDMRNTVDFGGRSGSGEDAYFARSG
jgi:hypothetical protein